MSENLNEKQRFKGLVNYFQYLADNKEQQESTRIFEWNLGLYIAKRIFYISRSNSDNLHELKLLIKILEIGKVNFGSAWMDLFFQANYLEDKLSKKSK